ncbi:ABC transporter G family member 21-like [Haliotis rubra]|uniref:ABC transporter G family member 21-like n=1 Tax=Haliotis rubra TaxID=36100 RepID=UPI001EE5034C|nr:ABC transporter G family member 21-like [Haliotis rubra]XP_046546161.1 ABC transporter G family member 21-like [Haliotis rubra]
MADMAPMLENGLDNSDDENKIKVLELVFRNINYRVGDKHILQDISGIAQAGQLLAVMGPSGSGKTSLLNALAGRNGLHSGDVTLNKRPLDKQLKRKVCYVLQEDIFFAGLTLRETLMFTTMMRLPDYMNHEDKMDRMEDIIDALDLRGCLDTIIGDALVRGLSGGEKKRANIACELITDPAIILLDEPTSGLDYSIALSLVKTLKQYTTERNKMVITTLHQPSSQMFYQFDKLLLMSEGELAYFGDSENVMTFFKDIGMPMAEHYNPADFIVEKLREDEKTRRKIVDAADAIRGTDNWPLVLRGNTDPGLNDDRTPLTTIRRSFKPSLKYLTHSPIYRKVSKRLRRTDAKFQPDIEASETGSVDMLNLKEDKDKWPTGFFTQFKQLTVRTFKNSKSRILNKLRLLEALLLCVLVSLLWFQLPRNEETLRDRMGVIFFIALHWSFTPLFDAVSTFPSERVVIQKERSAGWYRLSAYYFAKMTSELPLILLLPTAFIIISYWCIGLNGAGPFFGTIFTVMLGAICGQSIGLFLGIVFMDFQKAMSIVTLVMMAIMLLGGFYTRHLPFWLDWIKYFSFLHYTFHCLMVLEFSGDKTVQCATTTGASQFSSCLTTNETSVTNYQVLSFYEVQPSYWVYVFPLIFFICLFRLLGYLILRFVHKPSSV